jgi:predicted transcriptional regulator
MAIEFVDWMPEDLWSQLAQIAEVTDQAPSAVAVDILREGVKVRMAEITQKADAEVFRLEAELTAARARQAGLNGSPQAPVSPVEPSNGPVLSYWHTDVRKAVKGVLGADRARTFTTPEVIEQLEGLGYDTRGTGFYHQVNNSLRALVTDGEARRPVRGQYTWRRRPPQKLS